MANKTLHGVYVYRGVILMWPTVFISRALLLARLFVTGSLFYYTQRVLPSLSYLVKLIMTDT